MQKLEQKSTSLGLELGSTRIKAVLAGPDGTVLASGAHDWQNRFEGGYWTYHGPAYSTPSAIWPATMKRPSANRCGRWAPWGSRR